MKIFNMGEEKVYSLEWNLINSNMYLIYQNKLALVIDPIYTKEIEDFLLQINPRKITALLTHEHFDHINGVNWLRKNFDTEVCCSKACAERICSASKNLSDKADVIIMFNEDLHQKELYIKPFECEADITFEDTFLLNWNDKKINIISTPGHSPGSVCIFLMNKYVFTGDTLLPYPTITRLPGGNKKIFFEQTIPLLKKQTGRGLTAFPGHGEPFAFDDGFESDFYNRCHIHS